MALKHKFHYHFPEMNKRAMKLLLASYVMATINLQLCSTCKPPWSSSSSLHLPAEILLYRTNQFELPSLYFLVVNRKVKRTYLSYHAYQCLSTIFTITLIPTGADSIIKSVEMFCIPNRNLSPNNL